MRLAGVPAKYRNVRSVVDGVTFASKREARRYQELVLLQRAGVIRDLQLQPRFALHACTPAGELVAIGAYVADFTYRDVETGATAVEDAKGVRTAVYRLKRRHVEAQYGIRILEV